MRTQSVVLSAAEGTALDILAARHPGASLHLIHLAVLRIGLRTAREDAGVVADELGRILEERRARRKNARADRGGAR